MRLSFRGKLWLICAIACVIRVALVWQARDTLAEPGGYALAPGTDMPKYVRYARLVLEGHLLAEDVTISPLAPLVVLPVLLTLAAGNLVGAMMWQGALGAVQIAFIGLIGKRFVNDTTALVAAALGALYVPFIVHDAVPLTETTINVTFLAALWLYLRLREETTWSRAAWLGAAWGLAIAAKPTMMIAVPLFLLGDCVGYGWQVIWKLRWKLGVTVAMAIMLIAPFIMRARLLSGEWLFLRGNTGYTVLMGNFPGANGARSEPTGEDRQRFEREVGEGPGHYRRRDAVAMQWVRRFWKEQPGEALKLTGRKIILWLSPREIPNNISQTYYERNTFLRWPVFVVAGLVFPLATLGLIVEWPRRRQWCLPLALIIGYSALIIMTVILARLRLPIIPLLLLLAASALVWLYNEGQRLDQRRGWAVVVLSLALLALNQPVLNRILRPTLQPLGLQRNLPEGVLHVDGPWNTETAYSAWIDTADGGLEKKLLLTREALASVVSIDLQMRCVVEGGGAFVVQLNDCVREVEFDKQLRRQNLVVTLPFPVNCVRTDNQISVRVSPGTRLRVFLDDDWSYGRSSVRHAGEDFHHDIPGGRLVRTPHLIGGEFQVGLLLRSGGVTNR